MRQLPLFKFGSRAKTTSWGIALCTMFIVASFSIANGLGTSMDKLSASFESDYYLISKPSSIGADYFEPGEVAGLEEKLAMGVVTSARIFPFDEMVMVFSIADPYQVLPVPIGQSVDTVLESKLGYPLGPIELVGVTSLNLTLGGLYSSSLFPSDWLLAPQNVTWVLTDQNGRYNFAIGGFLGSSEVNLLEERGFTVQAMVGIIDFLESGVDEIRSDMSWVLLPSAFVIAVLAYSFVGAEVSDRRHEIGILKTIGAGRLRILSYLLSDAFLISAWGGLLGIAFGILLSYAVSTAASSVFTSVFIMRADEALIIVAFLATLAAGILGALLPAFRMTMSSPVSDLKEVGPSS